MNIELLKTAGTAAFGNQWQTDLSQKINVSPRAMRYWVSGEREMPKIANELVTMLETRKRDINKAITALTAMPLRNVYTFNGVDFYKSKEQAMSNALLHYKPSKFKDLAVIPYFCILNVVNFVDGERTNAYLYAMKFMEKLENREFNNENFNSSCYWTAYEFDESEAGVISYEKLSS